MIKKISIVNLILLGAIVLNLGLAIFTPAIASGNCNETVIFGIPAWYRGLVGPNCEVKSVGKGGVPLGTFITTLILNIGDMVMHVVAVASVLFIIFGGIKYTIAQGEEARLASAKKTVTNAIIGLIISLLSIAIINGVFGLFI